MSIFILANTGVRIADKAVLKMMGEMGLRRGIRRETDRHRYSSYRGRVGETFENVLGRDFAADALWRKMCADVTEFKLSFGRAHLAPVYDFGSEEIVAHSISLHPDLAHQEEMLGMPMEAKPEEVSPIPHSDMGWRYQHAAYVRRLAENGFIQSMSRKGDCLDNGATEQVVNVNPSFTDSTNAIAPIAPTHPRRFRLRQAPFPASRSGARSFVR